MGGRTFKRKAPFATLLKKGGGRTFEGGLIFGILRYIYNTEVRKDITMVIKTEWLPSIGFCTLSSLDLPYSFPYSCCSTQVG